MTKCLCATRDPLKAARARYAIRAEHKGRSSTGEAAQRTSVADVGQVLADAGKFARWHAHNCAVLCVWDAQVLAVNVHELELKVTDTVILCRHMLAIEPAAFNSNAGGRTKRAWHAWRSQEFLKTARMCMYPLSIVLLLHS